MAEGSGGAALREKVVLVTGAARGIGAAISSEAARQGARVVMTDVDDRAAGRAGAIGATFHRLDVTDERDWQRVVNAVETEHGALHGLVNNAGRILMKPLLETTLEDYRGIDTALARAPMEALVASGRMKSVAEGLAAVAAAYPGGRMGQPDDVAGVVAFLLSDAARFVNGVEVPVDAGFTAKAQ